VLRVLNHIKDFLKRSHSDFSHLTFKVILFHLSDGTKKCNSSLMEVSLGIKLGVGKEVDQCSLFDEFVLTINAVVLELLLGVSQVLVLDHLNIIGPLARELLVLVVGVHIVEDREFRTHEVSEVTDFNQTNIVGNEELMMPDHSSKPVIVLPTTESRHGVDGRNIKSEENDSSTRPCESLVMW
jgi:hypothetical protein